MLISKIISGGQTGVDRGAIEAALESGFPYGGLIPKGRLAEDGIVPLKFDQMEEAPNKNYIFRTEWNVVHSDATLIITNRVPLSGGTKRTADFCEKHKKPYLVAGRSALLCEIADWLVNLYETLSRENLVINVAGPRESKAKGIQEETRKVIREIISIQRLVERHFGSRMATKPRPTASAPNSAV